mmetsp:Transcript_12199/g.18868  ORF Transcript_12199/g.18868 Transcript_12199/m.18868 type:complete len:278 (+) Transcript_12199:534-1367(+)
MKRRGLKNTGRGRIQDAEMSQRIEATTKTTSTKIRTVRLRPTAQEASGMSTTIEETRTARTTLAQRRNATRTHQVNRRVTITEAREDRPIDTLLDIEIILLGLTAGMLQISALRNLNPGTSTGPTAEKGSDTMKNATERIDAEKNGLGQALVVLMRSDSIAVLKRGLIDTLNSIFRYVQKSPGPLEIASKKMTVPKTSESPIGGNLPLPKAEQGNISSADTAALLAEAAEISKLLLGKGGKKIEAETSPLLKREGPSEETPGKDSGRRSTSEGENMI